MHKLKGYVIVRSDKAGVFAGDLIGYEGTTAILGSARRLWYWEGAASLSQMAMTGTSLPAKCKFPIAVTVVYLPDVIEILEATPAARKSIESVPVWQQ